MGLRPREQGFPWVTPSRLAAPTAICGLLSPFPPGDGGAAGRLHAQRREGTAPAAVHPSPQGSHAAVPGHPHICVSWDEGRRERLAVRQDISEQVLLSASVQGGRLSGMRFETPKPLPGQVPQTHVSSRASPSFLLLS